MKKKFITALAVTAILLSISSQCFAVGGVVFDPTAAANAVKSAAENAKQLAELKNQVSELKGIVSSMTGKSSYSSTLLPQISSLKNNLMQLTPTMAGMPGGGNIKELSHMLDTVFVPDSAMPREISAPVRKDYYQNSLKSALENSESIMESSGASLDRIGQLAAQIDSTQTLKAAQDLSNRLFVESISLQQQMVILLAQLTRAEASAKYVGVYSDTKAMKGKASHREQMESVLGTVSDIPDFSKVKESNSTIKTVPGWE
jgi:hypothetical protein